MVQEFKVVELRGSGCDLMHVIYFLWLYCLERV